MSSALTFFDNLSDRVKKNIKDVNKGGCGIFAAMIKRECDKKGWQCNIKVLNLFEDLVEDVSRYSSSYEDFIVAKQELHLNHIIVEIFHPQEIIPIYFDSDGIINRCYHTSKLRPYNNGIHKWSDYIVAPGNLDLNLLTKLNKWYDWNDTFDRNQIEPLRCLVRSTFAKVQCR